MSLRRLWLKTHRWLALSLGLALALVALAGAALTVVEPLDRRAHPELFRASKAAGQVEAPLESVRQALVAEFGAGVSLVLRPPREAGDSLWILVSGPWHGTVYIDPASGRELGRRGEREGVYNFLFELHSSLLLEAAGKPMLAVLAVAYLVLLGSGLVLWWPARWRGAWRVELRRGGRRALFDLHRAGGSVLGLVIAVSVVSGAYMAWRPLSAAVTGVTGGKTVLPPEVPADAGAARATLDDAVRTAQALLPEGKVGYLQVPASPDKPLRVRLKLPDDPHPNGLSSVWLHPTSGAVLRVDRWNGLDLGSRAYSVIYPLHTGELGGVLHQALNAVLGLLLVGFAGSGLWLWLQRRR